MDEKKPFLRFASPNERRTISRENLGYYHAVIVGAVYGFASGVNVKSPQSYFSPIRRCIEEHPFLSALVADRHTDKAFYQRIRTINIEEHITILDPVSEDSWDAAQYVLRSNLDCPFSHDVPPWRVVVLPFVSSLSQPSSSRCFVAFAYSHTILDGPSGVAFHRTFLSAMRTSGTDDNVSPNSSRIITTPDRPLPPPFDTPEKLCISWGFLLGPLIAALLPTFLANWLGLKAQASTIDTGTWTGSPGFFDPTTSHSKIIVREIEAPLIENAVRAARTHGAKLTATMDQVVARALSKQFSSDPKITNFVSGTPINLRQAAGVAANEMGEFASGVFSAHPCIGPSTSLSDDEWNAARSHTEKLADASSRLWDQPIGLLRYLPSIRKWMAAKPGQQRDSSFELSNVGAFHDEGEDSDKAKARIEQMVFAQPGMVVGSPICVNVASVKGGSLVYTVTWANGALGIPEADEERFIGALCDSIRDDFERF
ncbi:alcohol acetyltransferase [Podospora didyma]|uniref:Alcohol acetyltransferase n=1 Tax=Podospora didyma TaxID=330526 RepID=A0AAE0K9Q6_9PEZI|nr:alcohol acetyltransferase [Podospora didyma]